MLNEYPEEITSAEKKVRFFFKLVGYGIVAFILYNGASRLFGL